MKKLYVQCPYYVHFWYNFFYGIIFDLKLSIHQVDLFADYLGYIFFTFFHSSDLIYLTCFYRVRNNSWTKYENHGMNTKTQFESEEYLHFLIDWHDQSFLFYISQQKWFYIRITERILKLYVPSTWKWAAYCKNMERSDGHGSDMENKI